MEPSFTEKTGHPLQEATKSVNCEFSAKNSVLKRLQENCRYGIGQRDENRLGVSSSILVPEPRRLLLAWAEKYKERYRWRLRNSFETANPFGAALSQINNGLKPLLRSPYAFTGAAATIDAPFIDLDTIDLFLLSGKDDAKLRQLDRRPESGPKLRFTYPYDSGVFLYTRTDGSVPMVSNIQACLDLYARGGRDLKQADYLLTNAIEPRWKVT